MMNLLAALENSSFSVWLRGSPSLFAYPAVLTFHTLGLGVLVGTCMVLDLRILGFASAVPLATFAKSFRVMWLGFWVNALSRAALCRGRDDEGHDDRLLRQARADCRRGRDHPDDSPRDLQERSRRGDAGCAAPGGRVVDRVGGCHCCGAADGLRMRRRAS